jgi:NhaA family Na+:H+ antiporter
VLARPKDALAIERILVPFQRFAAAEETGGILLLAAAVIAVLWANSPWAAAYRSIWSTALSIGLGDFRLDKSLLLWINDGLIAVFFFVVGLEIKREIMVGELASPRHAALPIAAAIGGMAIPAVLYFAVTAGTPAAGGWGVPMATDIAFTLGIMALLGGRISTSLKVFLTALAIVDDIGAILVIAVFYTAKVSWSNLGIGIGFLAAAIAANWLGVRRPLVYAILGVGLWIAFLRSGVHATVAGVLLASTIPASTRIDTGEFLGRARNLLKRFEGAAADTILTNEERFAAAVALEQSVRQVQTPLGRLGLDLHPFVAFGVMPLFALANAGVALSGEFLAALGRPATLGIMLGLVIGKPLGITLFAWIATRLGLATLPEGASWRQVLGCGMLAGLGFTMSLFIAGLAFGESPLLNDAKVGVLAASTLAAVGGWLVLTRGGNPPGGGPTTPDPQT